MMAPAKPHLRRQLGSQAVLTTLKELALVLGACAACSIGVRIEVLLVLARDHSGSEVRNYTRELHKAYPYT